MAKTRDYFSPPVLPLSRRRRASPRDTLERDWTQTLLLVLLILFTVALAVFIFALPLISWFFNDIMGMGAELCRTPPTEMQCGPGVDYIELAKELGRYKPNGELWACGCAEGVFGDWACATGQAHFFSISLFISTAPGTGVMACLSSWPIVAMWMYGAGRVTVNRSWIRLSLFAFQVFYGFFLMNTQCIFKDGHTVVVVGFIAAELVHYVLLAWSLGCCSSMPAKFICVCASVGVISIAAGFLISFGYLPIPSGWFKAHAFWLGECVGLLSAFCIAPAILLAEAWSDDDDDDDREADTSEEGNHEKDFTNEEGGQNSGPNSCCELEP